MNKVFIKHNPYKLSTYIEVDGEELKPKSDLNFGESRLQEWFEKLPSILKNDYSSRNFEITFHGTTLDFEDMKELIELAKKDGINIELKHIKGQEMEDKESKIYKLFQKIQNGPIDELRKSFKIKDVFESVNDDKFKVSVIATMSSGKSTLINALLGNKLMPSKQEACTAIVTEIKDTDEKTFSAKVYNKNGQEIESYNSLTYKNMQNINSDERVSRVYIEGDIPFVNSEDMALVLVDTPGPNNSRDESHKKTTYDLLKKKSKALVLYIMNATQLAVNDDKKLLKDIAEFMKEHGKQARDRFIFVLNKLDEFRSGEDSIESALETARKYLRDEIGIEDPNIYPVSALTALQIRTLLLKNLKNKEIDICDVEEAEFKVKKFNRQEQLHLEKYAPLPISIKNSIEERLKKAKNFGQINEEALIHSGIVSLEKAIELYVEKYARTLKIREIVSAFESELNSANAYEKLKKDLSKSQNMREKFLIRSAEIKKKLNDGKEAKNFKTRVQTINFDEEISKETSLVFNKAQNEVVDEINETFKGKLKVNEIPSLVESINKFIGDLKIKFKVDLENLIEENVNKNARSMLEEYKNKLKSLANEVNEDIEEINIGVFEIMQSNVNINVESIVEASTYSERVAVGTEWVKNTNKKWYKPWTWKEPSYHEITTYENIDYVDPNKVIALYVIPIEKSLLSDVESAKMYAKSKVEKIKTLFYHKFDELDDILKRKMDDLERCARDTGSIDKTIKNCEKKIKWIENIKIELDSILDI